MLPVHAGLEAKKLAADIEKARADAANSLQDAGVVGDDQRFRQLMDAVDALLKAQGQAHDQMMDRAGHALDVHQAMQPPPMAQPAAQAAQ